MATRKRSAKRTKLWCSFVEVMPGKWRLASPECKAVDLWRKPRKPKRRKRVKR
jgi:hypothetical protein